MNRQTKKLVTELILRLHQSWLHVDWNHNQNVSAALSKMGRCLLLLFVKGRKSAFPFSFCQPIADPCVVWMKIAALLICGSELQLRPPNAREAYFRAGFAKK